ncbi:hypothetical protein NIB75_17580 [Bacteroides uniformis]|nr:hypothetical protein [Bacteroides uniformis]
MSQGRLHRAILRQCSCSVRRDDRRIHPRWHSPMNAGLVETATFGKEEVQRVPGGRQVGIISDGERL